MLFATSCCQAQGSGTKPAQLNCATGPIVRTFGKSPWRVYSCSDGLSLVVVSAPGSPAEPFYFMFQATANGHHLVGEGTGNKTATDQAYKDLNGLSEQEIKDLVKQTKAAK